VDLVLIGLVSVFTPVLTLFSGFGLGTILMPVFALFSPVPVAIAATAVAHLGNKLFKFGLMTRDADWRVVLRIGVPAAAAALLGRRCSAGSMRCRCCCATGSPVSCSR
jgi:uncharacterized membrane protein YfcA